MDTSAGNLDMTQFIRDHYGDDINSLRLKYCSGKSPDDDIRLFYEDAILQIECRRKFSSKLKGFLDAYDFRFPSLLAGEQASHESVARYHASLVGEAHSLIDLTAGLGIDFMLMALKIEANGGNSIAIEMDSVKSACLEMNTSTLGITSAKVLTGDSISILSDPSSPDSLCDFEPDIIFVDPARRGEGDRRLYDPADCSPDIIGNWDAILARCKRVIVKNSPMLDISRAVSLFPGVTRIHVLSVKNECKEVLIEAENNGVFSEVICVNIISDSSISTVSINADEIVSNHSPVLVENVDDLGSNIAEGKSAYLYEPDSSVMKAGILNVLLNRYIRSGIDIKKLSHNCHILFSETYIPDFPGRIITNLSVIDGKKSKTLKGMRLNVVCRDYPLKADMLEKRIKVKSGTSDYLYGLSVGKKRTPVLIKGTDVRYM